MIEGGKRYWRTPRRDASSGAHAQKQEGCRKQSQQRRPESHCDQDIVVEWLQSRENEERILRISSYTSLED